MGTFPWIAISIGTAIIGFLIVFVLVYKNRDEGVKTNDRALLIMGIIWLPVGIASDNNVFLIMGLVFVAVGLGNRRKWEDVPKWSELPPEQRKVKLLVVGVVTLLMLISIGVMLYTRYLA